MRIFITFLCWVFFTLAQAQNTTIDLKSSAVAQEPKCTGIKKTVQKEGRSDFWQCVDSWVYDHFSYPQDAFDNELEAVVWVPFVIDKKGVMTVNKDSIDISVTYDKKEDLEKGKYNAIKEVCYSIFANFPKVTPAKNTKRKVVAVKGSYPISFTIPKDEDKKPIKGAEGLAKAHEEALAPVIEKRAYRVGKEHLSEEETYITTYPTCKANVDMNNTWLVLPSDVKYKLRDFAKVNQYNKYYHGSYVTFYPYSEYLYELYF